ncbi:MAG: enoyl-CoA hydratase/isomerase family protein [Chloroflexi bacterium]|nr:enoyl-CoA hydratase/isomerase family protein [Chloroflexota bacterium]
MAERQFVKISVEDRVALITLDYPPANVLNSTTVAELADAFQEALADEQVKAIVLTGGGEFIFIAGADINEIVRLESPGQAREIVQGAHTLLGQIESSPKPVIAAINGHCLGGGLELAMACHLRIANNRAQLGQPEIGLGIIPGFGGTQRLPRLVGKGKALELILTGDRISGAEAANLGLVNKAVPAGDVLRTALGLAKKIAGHGALAIRATIESVSRGLEMSLEQGLALETESFASLVGTHDMREGLSAFLEKRQPKFADQ